VRLAHLDTPGPLGSTLSWAGRHPVAVDAALAVAAAAVVAPSSLQLVLGSGLSTGWLVSLSAAIILLHLAMLGRRSFPLFCYGLGCLGMLMLTLSPYLSSTEGTDIGFSDGQAIPGPLLPTALVFFVLLYTAAEQEPVRQAVACLAVALTGGALVLVRLSIGDPWWSQVTGQSSMSAWLVLTALIVAGAVGAYSLGRLRRTRSAYLVELQARALRTEADRVAEAAEAADAERRRIAREMHDVVSHSLAVMISQAEGGRMLAAGAADPTGSAGSGDAGGSGGSGQDSRSATVFATIAATGRAAMADMRSMLGVLRERDDQPEARAPLPGLADVPALLHQIRSTGTDVELTERGRPTAVSPAVGLAVYRLLQEALTNVVKHAGPGATAHVSLQWRRDELEVEVGDDGTTHDRNEGGAGLVGMRERVGAVGGQLEVGSRTTPVDGGQTRGQGWRVRAQIPLRPAGGPR
jgi:signal transduction histidine kinase